MNATVTWNPGALNAALRRAFTGSVKDAQAFAQARNPAPNHMRAVVPRLDPGGFAILMGRGPLAHIFEGGRQGGYPIQPGLRTTTKATRSSPFGRVTSGGSRSDKIAIKFTRGDQSYYRGAGFLGGPMAARPWIKPAGVAWVNGLYQRRASAAIRQTSTSVFSTFLGVGR